MRLQNAPPARLSSTGARFTRRVFMASLPAAAAMSEAAVSEVKALTFDVFGTVVDWRATVVREGQGTGAVEGHRH